MLRKMVIIFLLISLVWSGFPVTGAQAEEAPASGAVFYVSNNGSDTNPGTLESPFQTLEKARDAVRQLKQGSGLPDGGVTVYVRGGVYSRSSSFILEEQDSGTADKPITYKAYPGESVRLDGGLELEKNWFTPVTDTAVLNRIISTDARTKVLQADLRGHGITDYGVLSRHGYYLANDVSEVPPMELYIDGQGMTLARWPNSGTVQMGKILDKGPDRKSPDLQTRGGTFVYNYQRPDLWTQADDIWLDGIFGYSWEWSYNKIASIDTANKTITLAYGEMSGLFTNWYPDFHFAQNLLEELDMPGEYYIDRSKGVLYFMPTAAFEEENPEITVSMLKTPMINTVNVSHVTFEDLILENGRDSAVVIMGGDHVQIVNCEIRNFSNGGVRINAPSRWLYNDFAKADGVNHTVINSHIHHIGGTAVILNGGDKLTLKPGNNAVVNSHIHDFAYYHKAYNPAVILTGAGNRVTHSEIHDAPHPGLLIFGNDHLVEYNNIYDVCKTFSDLGAIYMNLGASPQERGSVIRRNYFHHIGEGKAGVQGVYPDNFTMGITIEENIFYKMGNSAVLNNGGSHIGTRNNLFIDAKVPYEFADLYLGDGPDQQISKNYMGPWHALFEKYNNFEGMPHLVKYPELANFFTENRYYPDTNTFQNNVVYNPTKTRSTGTNAQGVLDPRNLMQYANNWVTNRDPGFVNLAGGDLNLKPDAEVFQQIPGFPNIPFSEMGTTGKVGPYLAPDLIPARAVKLYEDAMTIGIGKTASLNAAVLPWNATNPAIQYTSSNPDVVKVDANGVLKGVNLGNAVVTAISSDNPLLKDEVQVTVEVGDGIMEYTDFENGRNGWPTDPNRSIVEMSDGNHMYKLLMGATTLNENDFSNYELTFKLKTPAVIPEIATFYVFDRQNKTGSGGRIGYRKIADGTSSWILYNGAWATVKENKLSAADLQPDTVYNFKIIVKGSDISVYVDDKLKLKASDQTHNLSGQVGFYAGGFSSLLFDDIKFSVPGKDVTGLMLDKSSYNMVVGEKLPLTVQYDPSDTSDRAVVWQSSDSEIASIDGNGVVTAVANGETEVTVTSLVNPNATAKAKIFVSDIWLSTDFDSGANGWPVDPNRSIVTVNGNKKYRIVKGANALHPKTFENYDLTFKLKTPAVIPDLGTLYVYDRQAGGKSGIIGYKKFADGTSKWLLYNKDFVELKANNLPSEDLKPDTEYQIRIIAEGTNVRVYLNGELRLEASNPTANLSGTIGFYVGGFSELWFDDVVVRTVKVPATAIHADPQSLTLEPGASRQIEATVVPSDATNRRIRWSTSNAAVATVTDTGLVTAVAPGTALIMAVSQDDETVKAEIPVSVIAPEYPIFNLDEHLNDREHWTVSESVSFGNGTVKMKSSGVYGYGGAKFGSGLIRFKAKIDEYGPASGWYGFAVRSERTGDPAWVGSNTGYLVVIKENQIELQSWKPGQKMLEMLPNTALLPNGEYDIEIGAIQTPAGVRFIMNVDGKPVLNYLDNDGNTRIAAEGYFNVYSYNNGDNFIELKPVQGQGVVLESVRLDAEQIRLAVGESRLMVTQAVYSNQSVTQVTYGVVYATDHPEIAVVNEAGLLTAVSSGTAKLTAEYQGKRAEAIVTVTQGQEPGDTAPPAWTGGRMAVTNKDTTSVTLTWSGASDNTGVTGYKIYKDGQETATVAATTYTVAGLTPDTAYTFQVQAGDAAGNWSADGPAITVRTFKVASPVSASGTLTGLPTVQEGKGYELSFGLKQVTGEIVGEDMTIGFDPALFQFVSAKSLLPNVAIVTQKVNADSVRLILVGTGGSGGAVTADGEVLKLRFIAKSPSPQQQAEGRFTVQQNVITNIKGLESEVVTAPHSVTILATEPGDLNGDGKISIGDLGILVGMYGKTDADPEWSLYEAADLNKDGEISLIDLTMIARKMIGE
ncbi:Right handed beta helix region [Paenibacillus sp. UNCCL117]|uniref:Ig-like domain-containing protein n=1 Tax=unclassified Paenibacillus TaxID=185978 RepID=UPI0008850D4E|nr:MULTISPECIES: Ig-like domain-containing protein [unclassified Paenibacillus]SDD68754.1 Right handed beta helix region [Paenibacillus sp. cl123]SFW44995.1 Right handed beta helix region [Paenibacillus sp. UNCCL117]